MKGLVRRDEMPPDKYYAIAYVVDDKVNAGAFRLCAMLGDGRISFRCGSGWLNIPRELIIAVSDREEDIERLKGKMLRRDRDDFPILNEGNNKYVGQVTDGYMNSLEMKNIEMFFTLLDEKSCNSNKGE